MGLWKMYSKSSGDEKESIMGTHIAGVLPKYFTGCQWGFFGRGKVEHVLRHVWMLIWKVLYGSQRQLLLSWRGSHRFRKLLKYVQCKLMTSIWRFGLHVGNVLIHKWHGTRKYSLLDCGAFVHFPGSLYIQPTFWAVFAVFHTYVNLKWWLSS